MELERAKEIMRESGHSSELYSLVGYNSSSYFIRVFRKLTGTTPVSYDKNIVRPNSATVESQQATQSYGPTG